MVEGWKEDKIKNCVKIETGSKNTEDKEDDAKYPFFVRSQKVERISTYSYDEEAVLTAGDGVGTGKVFHYINGKFDAHQRVYVMTKFNQVSGKYFYYYFSKNFYEEVSKYTAKSSVDSVRRDMIAEMDILIPSEEEQERIVAALSDIDSCIASYEQLLKKKKDIQKGIMQQLMSGKTRLNGYNAAWEEKTLNDLCYLITKQTGFDYSEEIKPSLQLLPSKDSLPFIQNKDFEVFDINYITDYYIPMAIAEKYEKILLNKDCLLISISGRIGNVAAFHPVKDAFVGGAIGVAWLKDPKYIDWCMLYLLSDEGQKQIFANQKTGAQHNLTVEDVRKLKIRIPDPSEMEAIIRIIKDTYIEISELEGKIKKYKDLKNGMSQVLLSGSVRLAE